MKKTKKKVGKINLKWIINKKEHVEQINKNISY